MLDHDDLLAWAAFVRAPGLDAAALLAALDRLGKPANLLRASDAGHDQAALPAVTRAFLSSPAAAPREAERRWFDSDRHHLVPFTDPRYPKLLRAAPHSPIALYVAGNIDALTDPQLAIVGSRNPTPQGQETAFAFGEYLGGRGLGITSGLAEGIDAHAHRGALCAQGITLAVLGTGIDLVYPRGNAQLFDEIQVRARWSANFRWEHRRGAAISRSATASSPG